MEAVGRGASAKPSRSWTLLLPVSFWVAGMPFSANALPRVKTRVSTEIGPTGPLSSSEQVVLPALVSAEDEPGASPYIALLSDPANGSSSVGSHSSLTINGTKRPKLLQFGVAAATAIATRSPSTFTALAILCPIIALLCFVCVVVAYFEDFVEQEDQTSSADLKAVRTVSQLRQRLSEKAQLAPHVVNQPRETPPSPVSNEPLLSSRLHSRPSMDEQGFDKRIGQRQTEEAYDVFVASGVFLGTPQMDSVRFLSLGTNEVVGVAHFHESADAGNGILLEFPPRSPCAFIDTERLHALSGRQASFKCHVAILPCDDTGLDPMADPIAVVKTAPAGRQGFDVESRGQVNVLIQVDANGRPEKVLDTKANILAKFEHGSQSVRLAVRTGADFKFIMCVMIGALKLGATLGPA